MEMNELREYKKLLEKMNRQELAEEDNKIILDKNFWDRCYVETNYAYPMKLKDLMEDCEIKLGMIKVMIDNIER